MGAAKDKRPVGAPSKYSVELVDTICERIALGESLKGICSDPAMPSMPTVFSWLGKNSDFLNKYARAREAQADALFDEVLHIANTPQIGVKTVTKATGVETTEGDMIEHRRLQIDARKWMAGKLQPKKYGDKTTTEHAGVIAIDESPSDSRRKAALALLLARE